MRMMTKFFGIAVVLGALAAAANAQTAYVVGAGSSAMFLQLGLAAGTSTLATPAGLGAVCVWSRSSGATDSLQVTDTKSESGQAWIAWTPGTANVKSTCGTINTNTLIYVYVQTDSVIGNRLYFNGGTLGFVSTSPSGSAPSGLILGTANEQNLNATVWSKVNNLALTMGGTDIRPEDAKFATSRALAKPCNTTISGQYLGLGYTAGNTINSDFTSSKFNVIDFTLPTDGSYTVLPMGAAPIVVAVNPGNSSGFGMSVSNIDHTTLAKYLDGTYGYTNHLTLAGGAAHATILVREPLSGTYNTMEYSIPNTTTNTLGTGYDLETSQDVGQLQISSQKNCNGSVPKGYDGVNGYTMHIATDEDSSAFRRRVIGTGQAVTELLSVTDALGYAFWSTANFKNATSTTGRYLTVDGYDPLYDRSGSTYSTIANTIPAAASNTYLSKVTFTDLQAGNYPIWSLLRVITNSNTSSTAYIGAHKLEVAAQAFVSAATPDFVPFSNGASGTLLKVLHSHFAPAGVTFRSWDPLVNPTGDPSNGANAFGGTSGGAAPNCTNIEAGGDVGGAILTVSSDNTYCASHTQAGDINQQK